MSVDGAPHDRDLTTRFVRKARNGDRDGLSWVVERFTPYLHVSARQRISKAMLGYLTPEDLVQDVWVVAVDRIAHLEEKGGRVTPVLLSFLSSVMLHRYRDHLRDFLRTKRLGGNSTAELTPVDKLPDEVTGALTRCVRSEAETSLWERLSELGERDRRVVILRGIEQLPYKQIALILGDPPDTLRHRFRRALVKLRDQLPDSLFHEIEDE